MSKQTAPLQAEKLIFRAWVMLVTGLVLGGWLTSFFGHIRLMAILGPTWLIGVAVFTIWAGKGKWSADWRILRSALLFWPFLLLLALILAAAIVYPPTVHDSLSYRLPRILIWLQDGEISHVPVSDDRLNYMTHNWELVALPFFRLTGDRWLEVQNIASWLILFLVGFSWARQFCARADLQRWMALLAVAAYLPVLQAARTSNDLFALVLVLLSAWFFLLARTNLSIPDLIFSGMALALAAGAKPHYCLLAPFWLVGFILFYRWRTRFLRLALTGILAAPIALVVSPLPAFILNYKTYDSPSGPVAGSEMATGPFYERVAAGLVMSVWGNFSPPLNPVARSWNAAQENWLQSSGIAQRQPNFKLYTTEFPIVDRAALGIFAAIAWMAGIFSAVRNRRQIELQVLITAIFGLLAYLITTSQVVPVTIARSFLGFAYLGLPLVISGLAFIPAKPLKCWLALTALASAAVLVTTPSNPLWPAKSVLARLNEENYGSRIRPLVEKYVAFTERYNAGKFIKVHVPATEPILAVMGGGEPLLQLWHPYTPSRTVIFQQKNEADIDFDEDIKYVVIGGIAHELHAQLINSILYRDRAFELVAEQPYMARFSDGLKMWQIYEIREKDE